MLRHQTLKLTLSLLHYHVARAFLFGALGSLEEQAHPFASKKIVTYLNVIIYVRMTIIKAKFRNNIWFPGFLFSI